MSNLILTLDGSRLGSHYAELGDAKSFEAQATYEQSTVAAARAIVAGELTAPPTVEHLRVLLDWLDVAPRRHAVLARLGKILKVID